MPGVSIHLALANRVLSDWIQDPRGAPFMPRDPTTATAFRIGALGPDVGYFPGGVRIISDLAHRVRTVDLTRELVASARTPVERAFAWGWVTHLLADRAIHPLVGRGVGEAAHGDADRFVEGMTQPALHLRIEMGLDLVCGLPRASPPPWRMGEVERLPSPVAFLQNAYRTTYGIELGRDPFLLSFGRAMRLAPVAVLSTRILGWLHESAHPAPTTIRAAISRVHACLALRRGIGTLSLAYWNPILPSPWLRQAVEDEIRSFPARFAEQYGSGLDFLENFDLDTGRSDVPNAPTLVARRVLRRLRRFGPPSGSASDALPALAAT